jgi:MoxR-like ATPase
VKKIYEVLEGVYNNESLRRTIVPLFIGNPGLGKSVIVQQFAQDKGVKIVELITSQMSPFEISGIAMK